MTLMIDRALQKTALTLLSAVLFVGFFELNDLIFYSLEHREGINWLFLPAGFRVILVLVLGLPGAVGLMLGGWYVDWQLIDGPDPILGFLNGVAGGLTPWLVMKFLQKRQWLSQTLHNIHPLQLLNLTLATSAASAAVHQIAWHWMDKPLTNIWVDVWPMFIGNVSGALVMLYGFKFALDRLHIQK
jgi:hypothetical protein